MITTLEHPTTTSAQSSRRTKALGFTLSGTLHDQDYKKLVPMVDEAIERHGPARLLVRLHDFHGWDAKAALDDLKFGLSHASTIERIALVGEKDWHEILAMLAKPFTRAKVRYFNADEIDHAWDWLDEA